MVTILFISVIVLAIFLASAIVYIMKMQQELELLGKEQHVQNEDIYNLMKNHIKVQSHISQHQDMLTQHIEILKYLVEQDPMLNKKKVIYGGPIGEA